MSAPRTLTTARRFEHWLGSVDPLVGPPVGSRSVLWLVDRKENRLVGLDRETGVRIVDEHPVGGSAGEHVVVENRARRRSDRDATFVLDQERNVLVGTANANANAPARREIALPAGFSAAPWRTSLRHVDGDVWLVDHPSRGKVKTRLARLAEGRDGFEPTIELDVQASELAFAGDLVAVHEGERSVVSVRRHGSVVHEVPVPRGIGWFSMSARGEDLAFCAHLAKNVDGSVVVAVTRASLADGSGRRTFGLTTQGATSVLLTAEDLLVHQYGDVLLLSRASLAARESEVGDSEAGEIWIEDVATPPPTQAGPQRTARVSMMGESTGIGFAILDAGGQRKRLASGGGPKVAVGETILVDSDDDQVIARWHRVVQAPQTMASSKRCFRAMAWSDLAPRLEAARSAPRAPSGDAGGDAGGGTATVADPVAAFCTSVDFDASLVDGDTEEDILDEGTLRTLEGRREASGDVRELLFDDEIDSRVKVVAIIPVLRFDATRKELRFSFDFRSNAEPTADDRARMTAFALRLHDGGWGANYEFELPDDIAGCHVFIGEHRGS